MPAAAVTPAPIAYIKVVAVKTFVVELVFSTSSTPRSRCCTSLRCLNVLPVGWLTMH